MVVASCDYRVFFLTHDFISYMITQLSAMYYGISYALRSLYATIFTIVLFADRCYIQESKLFLVPYLSSDCMISIVLGWTLLWNYIIGMPIASNTDI